jgi:hypothetical protein
MIYFAGSYRELSRQVGVELALIDYDCVHQVGFLCPSLYPVLVVSQLAPSRWIVYFGAFGSYGPWP